MISLPPGRCADLPSQGSVAGAVVCPPAPLLAPELTGLDPVVPELREACAAAVARLREDDQLVIAARYFLGLSEAETAIALGLRAGTVKSRLSRALGRLQQQVEAMP